ncbi:MAG: adenine deaminase [Spirosomataceae bacterium]
MRTFQGNIVDLHTNTLFFGEFDVDNQRITAIRKFSDEKIDAPYFLPGFVDAHVHIESSLLPPAQFARLAVTHGTVGTVSDPHEIANVLGVEGVKFMIENGKKVPFHFCFGAPSCVPATTFETAGATVDVNDIEALFAYPEIGYLAEMMNFPGVIQEFPDVLAKLDLAKKYNKPIDGHAPGLRGETAAQYFSHGITTDHECFTLEEAEDKLKLGVKILIREGSAAKNFDALIPLALTHANQMMFCSDDKHPDSLLISHINELVKRAIQVGVPVFDALKMASLNPIKHYNLSIGLLQEGDFADFICVDNLMDFTVQKTYIRGEKVAEAGVSSIPSVFDKPLNFFVEQTILTEDIQCKIDEKDTFVQAICVLDGQLITERKLFPIEILASEESRVKADVLKIVVVNRYNAAPPAVAFIHGFGLKKGAIASSVAHDSHNIIVVGVNDDAILQVISSIMKEKGGLALVTDEKVEVLGLPIAGLMSDLDAYQVAQLYTRLDKLAKEELGSSLLSPFMSLSFMALLVIPSLKLSDLGLFDGGNFAFTPSTVRI